MPDKTWSEIEKDLADLANDWSFFRHLNPVNEQEQRKLFEAGEISNPEFRYPELTIDAESRLEDIENIKIPEGEFTEQFVRRVDRQRQKMIFLNNLGDSEKVIEASTKIYGGLQDNLTNYATDILGELENKRYLRNKTAEDVEEALKTAFKLYENHYDETVFKNWQIERKSKKSTTLASKNKKKFKVGERDYLSIDPSRLVVHELGVHALRKINKDIQREDSNRKNSLRNFVYDSETEEGLATNLEIITETENPFVLRKYCLRSLAVRSVTEGNSFGKTYEKLSNWSEDEDMLWNATLRAHRGGGLVKDHIYLQGRKKVEEYLDQGGRLKPLYVSQIPLDSVHMAEELMEDGELNDPAYRPGILHSGINEYW